MTSYINLGIASLLPVIASVLFFLIGKIKVVQKVPRIVRQIFLGIVFGIIAIIGTEWGIPINGAQVNCRDAAPICAGLIFGAPAGIIAGVIGGFERWIAVAWGVGAFTRVACSVSTLIAGLVAAFCRVKMFDNKKPGWLLGAAMAFVIEIFHLSMVFITNIDQAAKAASIVKICVAPMVIANTGAVMLACIIISILSSEKVTLFSRKNIRISQSIQRGMFFLVTIAFVITTAFIILLQNELVKNNTTKFITQNITDVSNYVTETSDSAQIAKTKEIARDLDTYSVNELSKRYGVAEISIIDSKGIIRQSTNPDFIGFDMNSTEQSKTFMVILDDKYGVSEIATPYGPIGYDSSVYRKYAAVKYGDGMVQIGYDADNFQNSLSENIASAAHNRHIGETGFIVIADNDLNPVSQPENFAAKEFWASQDFENNKPDVMYETIFAGVDYCIIYEETEGYYVAGLYPSAEAYQMRDIVAYVNSFMEILVFAAMFILIYLIIRGVVVDKINKVNESLRKITAGDLDTVVDVRTNEEFDILSNDINSTVDRLKEYIAEAEARIDAELEFAKKIQSSSLPSVFPAFPQKSEFDIYACMFTAKEVGGDFYDFYLTDNNTLNILMADVSGKGIPAALFMMRGKTELKSLTEAGLPLNEVFTKGNNALCEGNDAGLFITAWQASIDLESGLMTYVNAGHNPPIIGHADGTFEYIQGRPGFVLAGMEGVNYKTQEYQLEVGDTVYIYTDGVTEATDANDELYGEDRLIKVLNKGEFTDVKSLCEKVKVDVDEFVGEAPQFDDITMLATRYFGKQN